MLQQRVSEREFSYDDRPDRGQDLGLLHYFEILKRRLLYFVLPFVLIFVGGALAALLWPAIYVSEGKILIESQAMPVELVRPTVTTIANERVQVIEQRIMTRDNLLAIVDKFQVFGDRRQQKSGTELLDMMRERTHFRPLEIKRRYEGITIAFTVGFEHERPDIAMKVANEFVTLVLSEDARSRTARAVETTRFLDREVKKLEGQLGSVEAQIFDLQRRNSGGGDELATQLAKLRGEMLVKSSVYSETHPSMVALKRQIAVLEQVVTQSKAPDTGAVGPGLDALERQQAAIQKDLETASQKLSAARLGESLERDQQSERLEVIEQPTMPQKPVKPNRWRILALALALAAMAGVGGIITVEAIDQSIRGTRDLANLAEGHLVVAIPYISTRVEAQQKKGRLVWAAGISAAVLLAGLAAFHWLVYPVDLLWAYVFVRLFG